MVGAGPDQALCLRRWTWVEVEVEVGVGVEVGRLGAMIGDRCVQGWVGLGYGEVLFCSRKWLVSKCSIIKYVGRIS